MIATGIHVRGETNCRHPRIVSSRRLIPALVIAWTTGVAGFVFDGDSGFGYPETSDFLPQSPGVTAGAPGAFYNPAAWAVGGGELAAWLTPNKTGEGDRASWGL